LLLFFAAPLLVATLGFGTAAGAEEGASGGSGTDLGEALTDGRVWANIRYRFEHVDQDGFTEDAEANTIRTRLGYETGQFHGFSALLEFENVTRLGPEDFNDTVNGRTAFPVVADPESTDVNQASLAFSGLPDTRIAFGRQRLVLSNHRFIGDVGFRQNQQTYDAVSVVNSSLPETKLTYLYAFQVNRVFGEDSTTGDFNTSNHSVQLEYTRFAAAKIEPYAHLFDVDEDVPAFSTQTYGLRVSGKPALGDGIAIPYAAELAYQTDYADNPANIDLYYYLIEPGISYAGATLKLGYEVLEGDGTSGFQTPFATLHAFQGWADKFLVTPAGGIEDLYVALAYTVKDVAYLEGLKFIAVYHDFNAEDSSSDYGEEIDLKLAYPFLDYFTAELKYADYRADSFSTDTEKFWASLTFKY
jgi:hypothetical protein